MFNSKEKVNDIQEIINKAFTASQADSHFTKTISNEREEKLLDEVDQLPCIHSEDNLFIEMTHNLTTMIH